MKKRHAKKIREITEAVGEVTTETTEWIQVPGEFLALSGLPAIAKKEGRTIDPKLSYEIAIPVTHHHSVKKDLKRALRKSGNRGLVNYVKKIHDERVGTPKNNS